VAGAGVARGPVVVAPGASRVWLAPHPVARLGPGYEDLADLLVRLGVRTLGDLAGLPAPTVLGRFGSLGAAAHRLARGLDERPLIARTPPPNLAVAAEMDPPEQRMEAAAFVAKALADELHLRLAGAGLACSAVTITAETEHGETLARRWRHEGALSAEALAERARWQLDGWLVSGAAPSGGLTLLHLAPEEVRPDLGRQPGFWGEVADRDTRAARAFARVQGLLGPDAVVTAVLAGGRGPGEQVRLVPWGSTPDMPDLVPARRKRQRASASAEASAPWPGRLGAPSPAVVHPTPFPAEVGDASGQPVAVSGRGVLSAPPAAMSITGAPGGAVVAWAGPWPAEERWWDQGGRRRARLQVLLEGGEAFLVVREGGRWWVEATYG
ncbi:MAG: DNA polymerase Y family protein, partial [Acidimicrobiales bacterium]